MARGICRPAINPAILKTPSWVVSTRRFLSKVYLSVLSIRASFNFNLRERFRVSNVSTPQSSGIEAVLRCVPRPERTCLVRLDQTAVEKWARLPDVELWQAVLLHSFVDPDPLGVDSSRSYEAFQTLAARAQMEVSDGVVQAGDRPEIALKRNLDLALSAIDNNQIKWVVWSGDTRRSNIRLSEFHAWALRTNLPVVDAWPDRTSATDAAVEASISDEVQHLKTYTKRLRALKAAADRFWKPVDQGGGYVPGDKSTVSDQSVIAEWIEREFPFIGGDAAAAMATVLRPDELPSGRYKGK